MNGKKRINLIVFMLNSLHFRSHHDDFQTTLGKCQIQRDPHPQWRRLAWSPDGDMVAYTDSYGNVSVFDMFGTMLCRIDCVSII